MRSVRLHGLLILAAFSCSPNGLAQPAITVERDALVGPAGPMHLRGANWGWWDCVESGDGALMQAWGANVVRIAFFYTKITHAPTSDELGGPGLALLDAMCRWAEEAGLYFILDCHEPPGGCNTAEWCAGGANRLWSDEGRQVRFMEMWRELSRRYRHYDHLLAYELMNEPCPPKDYPAADYRAMCTRLVDALREEDPGRPCVVTGLNWGGPGSLTDDILLDRPGIIYTFHFYHPGILTHYRGGDYRYPGTVPLGTRWIANSPEDWGPDGTRDWATLEKSFTAPENATRGQVMLRSSGNSGTAWFDDVELLCDGEPVEFSDNRAFPPDMQSRDWQRERATSGQFAWDPDQGSEAPGALRISGTDSYDAWVCARGFQVQPGAMYTVRCRAKLENATGSTYPMVAWFEATEQAIDRDWLREQMVPALEFSRRNQVPLYCGEFGCSQGLPDGSGLRWMQDVASILNQERVHWTQWNWRESTGPGSMGVWVKRADGYYGLNGGLWRVLRDAWTD